MKKRTKIFCGVAILIAIVSMNIRHAWMNYGIAENKILAGVVADSMDVEEDVTCSSKSGYGIGVTNKKENAPEPHYVECVYAKTTEYYKNVYGIEVTIAIEVTNLATGLMSVEYCTHNPPANYKELSCKEGKDRSQKYKTTRITCAEGIYKGQCCYPKEAISDCDILIRQNT